MLRSPPVVLEPHPLDYDWRFTAQTCHSLSVRVAHHSILACGTPSLAPHLVESGTEVVLVDRNPMTSSSALAVDIGRDAPVEHRTSAVVMDPPWYPEVLERWLTWGAQHLQGGSGTIWTTVWPDDTRPTAVREKRMLLEGVSNWAEPSVHQGVLRYEVPPFEAAARTVAGVTDAQTPWRIGDLIELRVRRPPQLSASLPIKETWRRFVYDDYQLALRVNPPKLDHFELLRHPSASGWTWPSVSRRALSRSTIDLWSSRNEVAIVGNTMRLAELLKKALDNDTRDLTTELRDLVDWKLPPTPYRRTASWTHHE